MSLFKQVLKQIETNQSKKFNCISWTHKLPRFSNYIPGVSRGLYYGVTGGPSAGKTQFTDNVFLYHSIDFAIANDIELDITYFSFEIGKQAKMTHSISKRLFEAYGSRIPPALLQKKGDATLDEIQLNKLYKTERYFEQVEKYITFHDDALTPSQIFKIQMDKIRENGDYNELTGAYTPYNPDKYILFITDHISLITPDPGQNLHTALATFSRNNIWLKNKFGVTIVNIHQQGTEGQVEQFTNRGESIAAKLEPKLAGLGDNRTLGRDYDVVLGLFSPKKHDIDFHRGYKTKKFGDHCRFLSIIKNREGEQDISVALYFDGAVAYFEELPKADEFQVLQMGQKVDNEALYEKYAKGHVGVLDPSKHRLFTF